MPIQSISSTVSIRSRLQFPDADRTVGFGTNTILRLSEARDETSLETALADPAAQYCLFCHDRPLVMVGEDPAACLFDEADAAALGVVEDTLVLLGHESGAPRIGGLIGGGEPDPDGRRAGAGLPENIKAIDLRSLATQGLLAPAMLGLLGQARSLLGWHANHRFCARCGGETGMEQGGVRRRCNACGALHFPRVDPVVIMLAIHGEDCLLGRSHHFDAGRYSALAGFVEPGETIEDAVRRETHEESGIEIGEVIYFASQPWPFVSTLMIACHAQALTRDIVMDAEELDDCRWFSRASVRQMLNGTHGQGFTAPPAMAIGHRLLAAFAEPA